MLKLIIDKLEDVAEGLRDHYKEKDGKFHLQVEGIKTQADVDKVLAAKTKEVTEHKATKDALKAANDKLAVFGELDPDAVITQLQELETLKAAGPNAKAEEITRKAEEIAAAKFGNEKQKLIRDLAKVTGERDELSKAKTGLETLITQRGVDDAVRGAAVAAKVRPDAVLDLTLLARNDFKMVDGKVLTEDGRDPAQWLEDRKKTAPYLWPAAQGAGGQGGNDNPLTGGENPFSHTGWNLTKQGEQVKANPAKANQLAELAGTKVGGPRPAAPAGSK